MNVHTPPSREVPSKRVDCLTSFSSSFIPGISSPDPPAGMKILIDEMFSPVIGGSGSGNTWSILKNNESWSWTYNQRHQRILCFITYFLNSEGCQISVHHSLSDCHNEGCSKVNIGNAFPDQGYVPSLIFIIEGLAFPGKNFWKLLSFFGWATVKLTAINNSPEIKEK